MGKARISGHELIAGRYRLLDVVHQETNRVIWHGQDTGKGTARQCLLTRIELPADHDSEQAQRAADRMARRSQTMARICPGRVVPVLDAVTEVGALWTVTEWIDGLPLGRILEQKGALSPARAAAIGLELLDVLEAAHGEGITRGELSPGQVFVRKRGPAVVTGFGLTGATLAARVATPAYASPEQVKNERIGPASDLWALGAILYTMIEGRPPYRDLGLPETTPDSVDQLPLQAGNFDSTALGLLRTNSRERLTRTAVREALARLPQETPQAVLAPQPRPARILARLANLRWNEQSVTVGTALAILTAVVAALAVTHQPPGTETPADTSAQTAPSAIPTSSGQDGADTENK
ncbi:serine/threonine protein kinase, partial [Streptomyces populi]